MKYNYFVDGFKTTHTTFVYYLCRSIAYRHNSAIPSKEDRKRANKSVIFCRKQLSYLNGKIEFTRPYPCENKHLTFEITKAQ